MRKGPPILFALLLILTGCSIGNVNKEERQPEASDDITVLSENPTSGQLTILDDLATQQFKEKSPYKESKLHRIMDVMQEWTSIDREWFYTAEATIVSGFGAKE